jgi:aspartate/methionine/tyrosine aminotransferase
MEKVMEHMVSGVTAVSQRAALAAITASMDCVEEMVEIYDKRRCFIHAALNAIDGITSLMPESTFYTFANITATGLSSWEFAKYAARQYKVAVVPGSIFGNCGEGYVRLSFAASMEQLEEGVARLNRCVTDL